jgi:hypothetical protein
MGLLFYKTLNGLFEATTCQHQLSAAHKPKVRMTV